MEQKYRNILENQVQEKILGPGYAKDVIYCNEDASNEVLHDDPRNLYCTGAMLPLNADESHVDESSQYQDEDEGFDIDNNGNLPQQTNGVDEALDDEDSTYADDHKSDNDDRNWPSCDHIGVITCLPIEANSLKLVINYAKYQPITDTDIQHVIIKAGDAYDAMKRIIRSNDNNERLSQRISQRVKVNCFSGLFTFDDVNKTVSLNRIIPARNNERSTVSLLNFSDEDKRDSKDAITFIKMLVRGIFYRRCPKSISQEIEIANQEQDLNDDLKLFVNRYEHCGKLYAKVIIQNKLQKPNDSDSTTKYSLFQAELKVIGDLVSYTEPYSLSFDSENSINEFVYRDVKNYGKGIGCAVEWDKNGEWIKTTYMPRCDVKKFSNKAYLEESIEERDDKLNAINSISTLRNLSLWTDLNDEDLLNGLQRFVDCYAEWHNAQRSLADEIEGHDNEKTTILNRQQDLLDRLNDNIRFMRENTEALQCFKIANTAMLIQMVISRDEQFKKNRDHVEENNEVFNSIRYFSESRYGLDEPRYYPFQLAFLLMNVKSTFVEDDEYRTRYVDLIWFPTGGGKTEAYLALTALTIVARRRSSNEDIFTMGVSVIMRYTLRLLTSQQFERASFLICALEFLRVQCPELLLGEDNNRITIGLWIGSKATPNRVESLRNDRKYRDFLNGERKSNPYPVAYCPWCGQKLWVNAQCHGYVEDGSLICQNTSCCFNADRQLPIYYIDENIYRNKPTLLFATVDKFAQLFRNDAAGLLISNRVKSPDLIIQDELHLISGPLGSTVGLFESIVEYMASCGVRKPKIVASTATTRNTGALIKSLYGKNRDVSVFPAQGLSYEDNYFSHLEQESLRRHVGIMPTGWTTSVDTETRLTATLILSRVKVAQEILLREGILLPTLEDVNRVINIDGLLKEDLDLYWTIVLYYNSLKDLGRSSSRLSQEIFENIRAKAPFFKIPESLSFIWQGVDKRSQEFTSREDSSRIKDLLTAAESRTHLMKLDNNKLYVNSKIDLVYASNMISVGIDINRWNVMVMMGQPRSTSEYIQSSSRVARSHLGLVINLINPLRVREYSLFENYTSFHSAYYKYVEPLSATPLNVQMLKLGIWQNIVDCYRHVCNADDNLSDRLINDILRNRFEIEDMLREKLTVVLSRAIEGNIVRMNSLREIDPDCWAKISSVSYNANNR